MIQINKGSEPAEWSEKCKTPGFGKYEPIPELRSALIKEQGYICAYCMRRIPVDDPNEKETSKIEHIHSRTEYPNLQLDFSNMVICCPGNIGNNAHCDKSKAHKSISFDIFKPQLEESISYESRNGKIKSSNPDWDKEINDNKTLNLNDSLLMINRQQVLSGVQTILENKKWKKAELQTKLNEWMSKDKDGKYKQYCGIVRWYLKKKLRQYQ